MTFRYPFFWFTLYVKLLVAILKHIATAGEQIKLFNRPISAMHIDQESNPILIISVPLYDFHFNILYNFSVR